MSNKISYAERSEINFPNVESEVGVYGYPKVVQKVVNGKIEQCVEFIKQDPSAEQDFTCDDFALQNLLACGIKPQEVRFNMSQIGLAHEFEKVLEEKSKN